LGRRRLRRSDRADVGEPRIDEVRAKQRKKHDEAQHDETNDQAPAHARAAQNGA
jgi:hypothetical protein